MAIRPHAHAPRTAPAASAAPRALAAAAAAPAAAAEDDENSDGMMDCDTCDGTGEVDDAPCPDCNGTGEVVAPADANAEATAPAAAAPRLRGSAIAGSPEAKTHPHLALAAIQSGQTLAQFKASVAAVGAAPKGDRLGAAMAGATRLGPDAQVVEADKPTLSATAIYAKRAEAAAKR